jgi:uncharacterized surface protein with fasciclin (FAS1) repeats
MMTKLKKQSIVIFAMVCILFISCEDADDNGNEIPGINSILNQTENNPDLSMLNVALRRSGLSDTFDTGNNYTFFAPNNTAFNNYLSISGYIDINDIPLVELRAILLYHALNTEVTTTSLSNGYLKTLGKDDELESLDLFIEASSPVILNGFSTIVNENIEADNGIVHIIDSVLELPSIATLIAANPDFDNLENGLVNIGLNINLEDLDTMQDPFTVFAPNNVAFMALVDANSMDGFNDVDDILNSPNLSDILFYHVTDDDRIRSGDINNGLIITPLLGSSFTIDTTTGVQFTDGSGTIVGITSTDVTALNGIIHTIDIVARPM